MKKYLLVFVIILISSPRLIGQNSTDSAAYIIDYSDKLLLRIYTITKSNSLRINNNTTGKSLVLEPNGQTNIGLGFNY